MHCHTSPHIRFIDQGISQHTFSSCSHGLWIGQLRMAIIQISVKPQNNVWTTCHTYSLFYITFNDAMFYEPCMLGWSAGICCFWLDDVLDDALIRSSCRRFTLHEANIKGSECEMCSAYLLSEDFADRCRGSQVFLLRRGVWYFMGMAMLTNNPLGDDESDLSGNFSFQTFHLITFTRSHQTNRINLKI